MAELIRVLWESTDRYRSVYFATLRHRRQVNTEHRSIMEAIERRDTDVVVRLLREHREHALTALRHSLDDDTGTSTTATSTV
jgi:DNA-binding GntR family transcriptional regulator